MRLRRRMPHVRPILRGQASGSTLPSLLKRLLLAARRAATPAHLPNSIGHNAEEAAERPQWQLSYHMLHADAACRIQATSLIRRVAAHRRGLYARSVTCGHVRDMPSYHLSLKSLATGKPARGWHNFLARLSSISYLWPSVQLRLHAND